MISSVWSANSPQSLENESVMPESLVYLPSLNNIFFPFCLVSSVFDPGEPGMDVGFLFLYSNGKKSPF